jgi:hypothetical protein
VDRDHAIAIEIQGNKIAGVLSEISRSYTSIAGPAIDNACRVSPLFGGCIGSVVFPTSLFPCLRSFATRSSLASSASIARTVSIPAIAGNDEISPGVSWRLTTAALYPTDPSTVAGFLGLGNWLIPKVTVGSPELARDAVDLGVATKSTAFGVIEYCVFVKDLIDCGATTHGVIFAKYVAQITKQQGRYAVGHL